MKTFVRNWSFLTISGFLQQVLGFLCVIRIARYLQPENYGNYIIIITSVGIAQTIASLGLRQIVIREIARKKNVSSAIAEKVLILLSVSVTVSAIGLLVYLRYSGEVGQTSLLLLSVALLLSQTLWNFSEPLAFGRQEMQYSSILGILGSGMWFVLIYFLPASNFTLELALSVYVFAQVIRSVTYAVVEWRKGYFRKEPGSEREVVASKNLLRHSLPLYATNLLTIPVTQLPILFLGLYAGKSEVGFYGVGNRFVVPLTLISGTLVSAVYPILARDFVSNREAFKANSKRVFLGIAIAGMFMCWTLALFSRQLITILLGAKYGPAVLPFEIQIWVALNLAMHSFVGTIFLAADLEYLMVKLSVFNAVAIGAANFYGAHFGAAGLAVSNWCGLLAGFTFHWYFIVKRVGIKIPAGRLSAVATSFVLLSAASTRLGLLPLGLELVVYFGSIAAFVVGFRTLVHLNMSAVKEFFAIGSARG